MLLVQVIGKALMLDEIINYVQSLQRQVEVSSTARYTPPSNHPLQTAWGSFTFTVRNSY
jgi:hypothetical protein